MRIENNKKIYKIDTLLRCKVQFETPHRKREIPQCTNCQRYGRAKDFCRRKPRCVKWIEEHHTSNRPRKTRSNDVSVLCGSNDPANCKGRSVYKDLQKTRFLSLRAKTQQPIINNLPQTKTYQD